jgi:hypothetical protein
LRYRAGMGRSVRAAAEREAQIGEEYFPFGEAGIEIGRGACLEN